MAGRDDRQWQSPDHNWRALEDVNHEWHCRNRIIAILGTATGCKPLQEGIVQCHTSANAVQCGVVSFRDVRERWGDCLTLCCRVSLDALHPFAPSLQERVCAAPECTDQQEGNRL